MMNKIANAQAQGQLTEMEAKVMDYLMTNGFYGEYTFSDVTVRDVANQTGIDIKSAKGVVGSLVKKQFIHVSEAEDSIPPIVYATNKGYELSDEFETRWKPQMV